MGGRGTGKTTLLWLLASGLEQHIEEDKEVYSLLNSNLGSGRVRITVEDLDGEVFEVEKVLGENPVVYASDRSVVDFDHFKENIAVDFYKSSQIEKIGQNPLERLALIDKHLSKVIREAKRNESVIASQLNQNKTTISDLLVQKRDLLTKLEPLEDVEKELKEFEKQKPEGSEEQTKEFEKQNENQKNREFEKQFREDAEQGIRGLQFKLDNILSDIPSLVNQISNFDTPLNKELISHFKEIIVPTLQDTEKTIQFSKERLLEANSKMSDKSREITQAHKDQETQFTQLKQKFEKNREFFQRFNQLTKRVTAKTVNQKELTNVEEKLDLAVDQRKELLIQLKDCHRQIFDARHQKIQEINDELAGDVKITLKEGGLTDDYKKTLRESFRGKGFNYNEMSEKIAATIKPADFSLLVLKEDAKTLSAQLNVDKEKAKTVIAALLVSQDVFKIETTYCPDLPTFFLKVDRKDESESQDRENYRKTEDLSTGQRCTAILPIIFAASSNPLVIDQPEDNLDNKYIADSIHKIIKNKKDFRQMIFVTHNPNIPVLADAEFNLFLDYKSKKSKVDSKGTVSEVKDSILTLLEGGADAFKRRSEIYGY